jgi:hypothetical protein
MEVTPYFRLLLLPVVAAVAATQVRFTTAKPEAQVAVGTTQAGLLGLVQQTKVLLVAPAVVVIQAVVAVVQVLLVGLAVLRVVTAVQVLHPLLQAHR